MGASTTNQCLFIGQGRPTLTLRQLLHALRAIWLFSPKHKPRLGLSWEGIRENTNLNTLAAPDKESEMELNSISKKILNRPRSPPPKEFLPYQQPLARTSHHPSQPLSNYSPCCHVRERSYGGSGSSLLAPSSKPPRSMLRGTRMLE